MFTFQKPHIKEKYIRKRLEEPEENMKEFSKKRR